MRTTRSAGKETDIPSEAPQIKAAIRATCSVVVRLGVVPGAAQLLAHSDRICIYLPALGLVARVLEANPSNAAAMEREVAVAQFLSKRGAPAAPPAMTLPAGPHIEAGFVLSLWPYVQHRPLCEENASEIAAARLTLEHVHAVFATYRQALPSWRHDRIEHSAVVLRDPAGLPILAERDRLFLLELHSELTLALDAYQLESVPIHGDAHPANVLMTVQGPIWSDFGAACLGPRVWDFGTLGVTHGRSDLLALLDSLRSLCVSVWCWRLAHLPDKHEAAVYHLEHLKRTSRRGSQR